MLGAPEEKLITLGASVELLHTATLVHDDLIDGALLRRGMPTLNARWSPAAARIQLLAVGVPRGVRSTPGVAGGTRRRPART